MYQNPLTRNVSARGGVALFIIIFSGGVWILKGKKYMLISLTPIIIYDCMLLITIPAQDPRYILPGMECAIFLIAIMFGSDREKVECI